MESIKFKTDIKCMGCVAEVKPHLNETIGQENWEIDITNPSKILTVRGESDENRIKEALQRAGFKAEKI
jgi:copper chaperone